MKNKSCIINDLIVDDAIDILFITETWLTENDTAAIAACIPGTHEFHHCPREDRRGGGVGVAITKSFQSIKSFNRRFVSFECLELNAVHENQKMSMYIIYRPPNSNIITFMEEFESFVTESQIACVTNIYVGDFNIWMNNTSDTNANKMKELLKLHNLENLVTSPTHRSGNMLDLVITRSNSFIIEGICVESENTISDHKKVYFEINIKRPQKSEKTIRFRNKTRLSSVEFSSYLLEQRNRMESLICNHGVASVEQCVDCLVGCYKTASQLFVDVNAPVVEKKIKISHSEQNKWYNDGVRIAKSRLRRAEKKLCKNQTEENRSEFKKLRQEKCMIVGEAKKKYYRERIEACETNSTELYRVLNDLVGKNQGSVKFPTGHSLQDLPEMFKRFFIDKIAKINESFPKISVNKYSHVPDYPLVGFNEFHPVSVDEMKKILSEINKTNCLIDPYNIRLFNLEEIDSSLSEVFSDIVNASFRTGTFPSSEKYAIVKPLLKPSKDNDQFSSYRPVFNTSILSKVLEKACLQQISTYFENFEAIPAYQSAYKKYHSVETALCKIYHDLVSAKAIGKCVMLVMLDLSAAFDCIDVKMLVEDLKLLGVSGRALDWFQSYLTGRYFSVEIEDYTSNAASMDTGICQGTILAPLLFSIYCMELYFILRNLGISCHFYADDTQVLINVEDEEQTQQEFNNVFNIVEEWMTRRKLKLNADKTECIIFGNKPRLEALEGFKYIQVKQDSKLTLASQVKNLGVLFDQDLSMEPQIRSIKGKAIGHLTNISYIAKFIDRSSRLKLVYGLVLSRIDFCNSLYVSLPNNLLRSLQMIINSSARLITGLPRFSRERITPVCMELHFLPIKARIHYKICLLTFKALHYGQPSYLLEHLQRQVPARTLRSTHSNRLVEPVIAQSSYSNRCFGFCAPRLYNSLPESVRLASSLSIFKTKLKTFMFEKAYDISTLSIKEEFIV